MADSTPCYTGSCPECGALLSMAVADATRPVVIKDALRAVKEWEADGLTTAITTVGEARTAAMVSFMEHAAGCSLTPAPEEVG